MAEIFISYSRQDKAFAARLAKALQAAGHDTWWDADLPAHRSYSEVIERNLEQARAVVVIWSSAAAKSQWVRAEADFARNADKLVQAQVDGTLPPMPFNQIECADLKGWKGGASHAGWSKLLSSVEALISGEEALPSRAAPRARWQDILKHPWVLAASLALLAVAAVFLFQFAGRSDEAKPILAVLPFESLDARDASLVAGIYEDTRQAISRNPNLLVLGPNTSEELAKKGDSAARKAADYVLEASIRTAGNHVRISTDLVRTEDGVQVWSEKFDRKLDDVFALQSEIAGAIEGRIRGRLAIAGGKQAKNFATSGEVYALYSDARTKIRKRQPDKYEEAYGQLLEVVTKDPNFAPGWATLAVLKQFGLPGHDRSAESAEADARRAIALAPNLASAHAALGLILGESPAAQSQLRRALVLDPNDIEAMNWLAATLDDQTQLDEKLQLYSRIVVIEPLWWPAIVNKIDLLGRVGGFAAIEKEVDRIERLGDTRLAVATKLSLLEKKGDLSAAIDLGLGYLRTAPQTDRDFITPFLWQSLMQLGIFDTADKLSPPPLSSARLIPFLRQDDARAIDLIEAEFSPPRFWSYGPLPIIASRAYLLNKQGPRLAKSYRAIASSPEQFAAVVGRDFLPDIAPGAALALRSAGDPDQALALLKLAEMQASKALKVGGDQQIRLARIYAVEGRTREALDLLSTAIRGGWLPPYLPIHTDIARDPPLRELRSDPRFEPLRQQILGHLAKERAELGKVSLE